MTLLHYLDCGLDLDKELKKGTLHAYKTYNFKIRLSRWHICLKSVLLIADIVFISASCFAH